MSRNVDSLSRAVDPAELLVAAISANDAARVGQVLESHPELKAKINDPMPKYGFGATPLLGAVQKRNREMIDILLRAGADINARSLWWAGSFGVLDDDHGLAPFLIERGAIVDVHAASRLDMLEKVKLLITANPALVNARGGDGQTPLHVAASVKIAQYLLDQGADIDARDIDHESTPAQYMVRDRQDVARFLVTRGCRTDILMAAALGDVELVRKHLGRRSRVHPHERLRAVFSQAGSTERRNHLIWCLGWHKTAHLVAREFGHEEVFRLLMEHSPAELKLAVACELGDEALFKATLASRPNLAQTMSDDDRRKLADAAQNNNTAAVRLLLAAGWPVDVRGQHGATPLHWASWHGNADMVRELLRYHPPLEWADEGFGGTPLRWAIHGSLNGWHCKTGDYGGTVEALLAAGAAVPELAEDLEASEPVLAALRRK